MASHGGYRPGSGRKKLDPEGSVVVGVWMTRRQQRLYKEQGGAKWLRELLDKMTVSDYQKRMTEAECAKPAVVVFTGKSGGKVKWHAA